MSWCSPAKLGTFQKVPWLIYVLQLIIVFQAAKRLDIGVGRIAACSAWSYWAVRSRRRSSPFRSSTRSVYSNGSATVFSKSTTKSIYQTFYVYPDYLPHTWGMNIGLLHNVFGSGDLVSAHTQVANFFGADGATFDAFFVADAWVDFAYGGVLVDGGARGLRGEDRRHLSS